MSKLTTLKAIREWFLGIKMIVHAKLYGESVCIHVLYDVEEKDCGICQLEKRIEEHEPLLLKAKQWMYE